MDNRPGRMQPVDMFPSMFQKHMEANGHNLSINNFILLRNMFKMALKDSHLGEAEEAKISEMEQVWGTIGKGCGCTKNARAKGALDFTCNFIHSEMGQNSLRKIKTAYNLNTLVVDIPDPVLKLEI